MGNFGKYDVSAGNADLPTHDTESLCHEALAILCGRTNTR